MRGPGRSVSMCVISLIKGRSAVRLSTLGRYGARAMIDLAGCQEKGAGPTNLKEIAGRQDISYRYLEQIMLKLRAQGLVRSIRGAGGGFVLARPAAEITLAQVVHSLEGEISIVECTADPSLCDRSSFCVTHQVWAEMAEAMRTRLEGLTLEELSRRQALMMTSARSVQYAI